MPGYADQTGAWREAPDESVVAALAAMGIDAAGEAAAGEALAGMRARRAAQVLPDWVVAEVGAPLRLAPAPEGDWHLRFEDGREVSGRAGEGAIDLPVLPLGRHDLRAGGERCWLLAAPPRLPAPARGWGVTLPLYGLVPEFGGGTGTYADLGAWAGVLGRAGAGFVGVNPVHAGFAAGVAADSPYAPSHRRRFSTRYLTADEPAGGQAGPLTALVDHAAAQAAKQAALEARFAADGGGVDLAAWRRSEGADLEHFALHQALSERFGPFWGDWPEAFRDPASPEVAAFAQEAHARVGYHAWLQWRAETELAAAQVGARAAGMAFGLYLDLAVGTHPFGAETWAERGLFATGVSLGAPPDLLAPEGQTWGLAPFSPPALAATGFAALAATLRAQLRHAGLLRIDHILGFERAFWVPDGLSGLYMRMPRAAMLAVVRIEAARAGATVVGEDLGNIPDGLQAELAASGILGCRLAIFERNWAEGGFKDAGDWDRDALGSFTTHDLPTWKGWRNGRDIDWRARAGRSADPAAERGQRAGEVAALDAAIGGAVGDVSAMHRFLARTPCALVAVQAENLLGLDEQANLPGTTDEHPNWRRRLSAGAGELAGDRRLAEVSEIMRSAGRGAKSE